MSTLTRVDALGERQREALARIGAGERAVEIEQPAAHLELLGVDARLDLDQVVRRAGLRALAGSVALTRTERRVAAVAVSLNSRMLLPQIGAAPPKIVAVS